MNVSKALTWDNLANLYDKVKLHPESDAFSGRPARTLPMEKVFDWAEQQKDKFWVNPDGGTLHRRLK